MRCRKEERFQIISISDLSDKHSLEFSDGGRDMITRVNWNVSQCYLSFLTVTYKNHGLPLMF